MQMKSRNSAEALISMGDALFSVFQAVTAGVCREVSDHKLADEAIPGAVRMPVDFEEQLLAGGGTCAKGGREIEIFDPEPVERWA
jgi:hypothetical protein